MGFNFNDLFVFDLANNHQGDVAHARDIIEAVGGVVQKRGVRGVFKFQFRQLESFVHPAHQSGSDQKHIGRFLSTRLEREEFEELLAAVRARGMVAMCTPFDEESVGVIREMGFDLIKVASCSARDWPLLEAVAEAGLPVICSTGGLSLGEIDNVVSFLEHRAVDFALMHCVAIYPTPSEKCHLNQIDVMRNRFPGRVIGWSTHENPDALAPVAVATAKGARMFERHVGIVTDAITLNTYSSTPEQLDHWIAAQQEALQLCGSRERQPDADEIASLDSLRRGVYAREPVEAGQVLQREQIYFAMPFTEGQLSSGQWCEGITAQVNVLPDGPLILETLAMPAPSEVQVIKDAVHEVKALLNEARIPLSAEFEVEYSHHYGIPKFREHGAVIINCINRGYCKKIVAQLPGQKHPAHYHKLKEETFQVLHGILHLTRDGQERTFHPGDTCLVMPGVWHSFWTETGCVFEEVSTTHHNHDSIYRDAAINGLPRESRKTTVDHWGRYQLPGMVCDEVETNDSV
jgi:sialic acid synthase SpsE/mannose-6-phosphate isomerase-like protein (cupin superfamily)